MTNAELVKVDPKEFGLEEIQVATIEQAFLPKIAERDGYAVIYEQLITKELTKELCGEARELRLKLVKTRTGIAEIHKTQKAFFLAAGKFVDAWKNKETTPVEQMEEKLSEIEKYFEKIEAERIAKLEAERLESTKQFTEYPASNLGFMADVVFDSYLLGLKVAYNAKIKAEQEAEAERLRLIEVDKENEKLKAIEDERIRNENEKLKAEAIEKEKEIEAEHKRQSDLLAKQKADADEKTRIEAKKQAAILAKERAEAKTKQDAIELAARIERERAEAEHKRLSDELKARQDAEKERQQEIEMADHNRKQAELQAAKAPDKTKLIKMINDVTLIVPELKDSNAIAAANVINARFEQFKVWAKSQVESV